MSQIFPIQVIQKKPDLFGILSDSDIFNKINLQTKVLKIFLILLTPYLNGSTLLFYLAHSILSVDRLLLDYMTVYEKINRLVVKIAVDQNI